MIGNIKKCKISCPMFTFIGIFLALIVFPPFSIHAAVVGSIHETFKSPELMAVTQDRIYILDVPMVKGYIFSGIRDNQKKRNFTKSIDNPLRKEYSLDLTGNDPFTGFIKKVRVWRN